MTLMFMQQLPKPGPGPWVAVDEWERIRTSAPLNTPALYRTVFAAGDASSSAGVPYTVTVPGVLELVRNSATATAAASRGRASERSSSFMRRMTSAAAVFSVGVSCAASGAAARATTTTTGSERAERIGSDLGSSGGTGVERQGSQEVTELRRGGNGLNRRPRNWLAGAPRGSRIAIRDVPPIL